MAKRQSKTNSPDDLDFSIGLTGEAGRHPVTARKAGGLTDMELCISPVLTKPAIALRNLAKALNVALKTDFLETDLDEIYRAARVRKGTVQILHRDYFGLGDGVLATVGKTLKSFQLTLRGPDAASLEGEAWIKQHGRSPITGILNLLGRKLNLLQEFEDKVPEYVEQTLDRLEAKRMIVNWHRNEWEIQTTLVGLDVIITPKDKPGD
jgi:hypothetical protein